MVQRRADGTLLASWLLSTNPMYEGSDLQVSSSSDNGKTWMRPIVPHHDGTEQQHAFPAYYELPGNGLGVLWLDGRDIQPSDAHPEGGPMALRFAEYDAQWRRTREGVVDPMACECCPTTIATNPNSLPVMIATVAHNPPARMPPRIPRPSAFSSANLVGFFDALEPLSLQAWQYGFPSAR